jgi:hypothetical protein
MPSTDVVGLLLGDVQTVDGGDLTCPFLGAVWCVFQLFVCPLFGRGYARVLRAVHRPFRRLAWWSGICWFPAWPGAVPRASAAGLNQASFVHHYVNWDDVGQAPSASR